MDNVTGTVIDMRQDSYYPYWSEYDGYERDFQILVTKERLATRLAMPVKNTLLQNYPNPFNPETWIPYHLSESNPVEIRIYNATGQLIKAIDLGFRHAGYYDTKERAAYWDGRNENGEQIASGLYFYQISAGQFNSIRKMIAVR